MRALVTGGAGFIGSHLVDRLLEKGYEVRIIDSLEKPTHLDGKPKYLNEKAEFILGDICDEDCLKKSLEKVDVVFHLAAVGGFTGEITKYFNSNSVGTGKLFETIIKNKIPIKKIVVASSIAVYGEGKYFCEEHGNVYPKQRVIENLEKKEWEQKCPTCGKEAKAIPTGEEKPVDPQSIYSITKYDQEKTAILLGKQHEIPVVALRYFVTYGPRQSITNPYTGICSIFSTRIMNDSPPIIYEDGLQSRDMIYVDDLVEANILAMENSSANYQVFNVGTGKAVNVIEVAEKLISLYGKNLTCEFNGNFREADVRHLIADVGKIHEVLGFEAKHDFESGIKKYVEWIKGEKEIKDYFSEAQDELKLKKIVK